MRSIILTLLIVILGMSNTAKSEVGDSNRCDCTKVPGICSAEVNLSELNRKIADNGLMIDYRIDVKTDTKYCALVEFNVDHIMPKVSNSVPHLLVLTEGNLSEDYNIGPELLDTKLDVSAISCHICNDANHRKDTSESANVGIDRVTCSTRYCYGGKCGPYNGTCVNGIPDGYGSWDAGDGFSYEGAWKYQNQTESAWHGDGTMKVPIEGGMTCKGKFNLGDMYHGTCTSSKSTCTGDYKDGALNGYAKCVINGKTVEGQWRNNNYVN